MSRRLFRLDRLALVIAGMELLQGLTLFALPDQYDAPAYDPVRFFFPQVAALLLGGGVVLLMLCRYPISLPLRRLSVIIPALPMGLLAWLCWRVQVWTGVVYYGTVGLALLASPWLARSEEDRATEREVDWGSLTFSLIIGFIGLDMLLRPSGYGAPSYDLIRPILPLVGLAGIAAAGFLVASQQCGWRDRYWVSLLAAFLPGALTLSLFAARIWTGVGWALWSISYLLDPFWPRVERWRMPRGVTEEEDYLRRMERRLETWTWLVALILVLMTGAPSIQVPTVPVRITMAVLSLSLYNVMANLFLPHVGTVAHRMLFHLTAVSVTVGYLRLGSGPYGSIVLAGMVVAGPLATRIAGRRAGFWMTGLTFAFVLWYHASNLLTGMQSWETTLELVVLEWLAVGISSWVGISDASSERKLMAEMRLRKAELRQQYEKLALLVKITESVRSSLDIDQVIATTEDQVRSALRVDRCLVRLAGEKAEPEEGSALVMPIVVEESTLGELVVQQQSGPRSWQPEEIRLLEEVSGQVGVALALAKTHHQILAQFEELESAYQRLQNAHERVIAQEEELKELNDALRHSEERFASLLTITPNPIVVINSEQRVVFFNQQACTTFGYDEGEILGEPLDQLLPPRVVPLHRNYIQRFAVDAKTTYRFENQPNFIGRRKDGTEFPMDAAIAKMAMGEETYFIAVLQDVTERRKQEQILRESEERFRKAFENAPIGVAMVSGKGRWLRVNDALCRMLGYTAEELVGSKVDSLLDPAVTQTSCPVEGQLESESGAFQLERLYRHKRGHQVWVQQSCSLIQESPTPYYFIVQLHDMTERKEYEERLLLLASHDPLTGLYNRRRLQEELNALLTPVGEEGPSGALLLLDLDLFKFVNDTLGHRVGDGLLRQVAGTLQEEVGEEGLVSRLGGDEFAILLPGADGPKATAIAERILEALRRHQMVMRGRTLGVTASIGITLFPHHGRSPEDLLSQADVAMYQAKEAGRNNWALFTPSGEWRAQMESKLSWDLRIREALRDGRLVLYSQPILDLATDQVTRYELLLRMIGEDGEVIPPATFLGVAERYGLIQSIDRWVVTESIRLLAECRQAGGVESFEVNLSGRTISDPSLLIMIREELRRTGVDPSRLIVEITETAAIGDLKQACQFIKELRGLGCRFALDDVGSGFSTLTLLKQLGVDYVKIDGAFVQNLPTDEADQHLVKALVAISRSLGLKTIAEFVDRQETLELIRAYGVDYAQGYLIGRPEPHFR